MRLEAGSPCDGMECLWFSSREVAGSRPVRSQMPCCGSLDRAKPQATQAKTFASRGLEDWLGTFWSEKQVQYTKNPSSNNYLDVPFRKKTKINKINAIQPTIIALLSFVSFFLLFFFFFFLSFFF
jgi:hypothetical protein